MSQRSREDIEAASQQLLVEGANDQHVVFNLCQKHSVPDTFKVTPPRGTALSGGIDEVLRDIPIRLQQATIQTLGIMVDADTNLAAQWTRLRSALPGPFQVAIPSSPVAAGWISEALEHNGNLIRIGIWLMPNNTDSGNLEDFCLELIPDADLLLEKAKNVLSEIESDEALMEQRYKQTQYAKALLNTWLAWQSKPAEPMGRAIGQHYLRHDAPLALTFIEWLQRLFNPATTTPEVA